MVKIRVSGQGSGDAGFNDERADPNRMTEQQIRDAALKIAIELKGQYGIESARKIAKRIYRELRLPTAEQMRGIFQIMEAEETMTPFGW